MILTIRTDKPEAEIGLFEGPRKVDYVVWQAHRQLSETIHKTIETMLQNNNTDYASITALFFYEGPGSFTGLRIGASVVNALAESLTVPIAQSGDEDWIKRCFHKLEKGATEPAKPLYGEVPRTTKPKK